MRVDKDEKRLQLLYQELRISEQRNAPDLSQLLAKNREQRGRGWHLPAAWAIAAMLLLGAYLFLPFSANPPVAESRDIAWRSPTASLGHFPALGPDYQGIDTASLLLFSNQPAWSDSWRLPSDQLISQPMVRLELESSN